MGHTRGISIGTWISRLSLVGLLVLCAFLPCSEPVASPPLFADPIFELVPPSVFGGYDRTNPFSDVFLEVADLDGDGIPDLTGVVESGVSVAWGNDDGTFTHPWRSGRFNCCLIIGSAIDDLNGDGHLDIIMGSSGATLSILLGQADRSFVRVEGPSSEKRALSVAGGDFDEDGLRDIVNASTGNFVVVHPGNGDGTFRPFAFVPVAWTPTSLLVADLNGDGHDDIAAGTRDFEILGEFRPTISILLGHGDGTFETFVTYPIEPLFILPTDLVGGDFDGDGDIDLVTVGAFESTPAQIFRNLGDGTFEPGQSLAPVTSRDAGGAPAVGDLDGDGLDDLALCTLGPLFGSGRIALFRGDAADLLVPSTSLDLDNMPIIDCQLVDMDGDGDLDLALVDSEGFGRVLTNDGDGNFAIPGPRNSLTGISPRSLVTAQLDADRIPDLAVAEWDALVVLRGTGDGTFGEPQRLEFTPGLEALSAARLDGDDIDDLAVTLRATGQVAIFHGSPDGTLVPGQVLAAGLAPHAIALAPLNGDASVDMVVADADSDTLVLLFNDGQGRFTHGGTVPVGDRPVTLLAADLDGDGLTDLVSGNADRNRGHADRDDISVVFGSGGGFFTQEIRLEVANEPFALAAGDLDKNGLWDLVASPGTEVGGMSVYLGAPARSFRSAPLTTSLSAPRYVAVDDLNSDDIPDLLLAGGLRLQVLLGLGDGTFTPEFTYAVRAGTLALGDWNGDGRQDIAIASADSITLLQNQGPFPALSVPVELVSRNPATRKNTRTRGVMVMEIQSTDEVDATRILPETIRFGGAPVRQAGTSGRYLCQTIPMGKTSRPSLRCEIESSALTSEPGGSVQLEAVTNSGTRIRGEATLNSQ